MQPPLRRSSRRVVLTQHRESDQYEMPLGILGSERQASEASGSDLPSSEAPLPQGKVDDVSTAPEEEVPASEAEEPASLEKQQANEDPALRGVDQKEVHSAGDDDVSPANRSTHGGDSTTAGGEPRHAPEDNPLTSEEGPVHTDDPAEGDAEEKLPAEGGEPPSAPVDIVAPGLSVEAPTLEINAVASLKSPPECKEALSQSSPMSDVLTPPMVTQLLCSYQDEIRNCLRAMQHDSELASRLTEILKEMHENVSIHHHGAVSASGIITFLEDHKSDFTKHPHYAFGFYGVGWANRYRCRSRKNIRR